MLRVESVACGVDAVTSIDAVVEFMGRTTRNQVPDLVLGNQGMKETDCEGETGTSTPCFRDPSTI